MDYEPRDALAWRRTLEELAMQSVEGIVARFAQLATVDGEGAPANRTVAVRGFVPGSNSLLVATDRRSKKVAQIQQDARVVLCWYLASPRQQFRIAGLATIVDVTEGNTELSRLRLRVWSELSTSTRSQFYWPQPGAPLETLDAPSHDAKARSNLPDTFALVIIAPVIVDHLDISTRPHSRTVYRLERHGNWEAAAVNP